VRGHLDQTRPNSSKNVRKQISIGCYYDHSVFTPFKPVRFELLGRTEDKYKCNRGIKSLNVLLCTCHDYDLSPKTLCQLFDAFVLHILNYSLEIWGYTKSKEFKRVHLKFCKCLLRVRVNTCTAAVYGELGRYPLYIQRYVKLNQYWFKLIDSDNIMLAQFIMRL